MAIPAYSLYAAYPACSLWLFLPIHCSGVFCLLIMAIPAYSLYAAQLDGSGTFHYGLSQRSNATHY
jgi:hypothetical protein